MKIKLTKEQKWYSATIADSRICTQWDSLDELITNLNDAFKLHSWKTKQTSFDKQLQKDASIAMKIDESKLINI